MPASPAAYGDPVPEAPAAGQVRLYAVTQPDNSTRDQLIFVTHVTDEGKVRGVPLGYADDAAEFTADQLR